MKNKTFGAYVIKIKLKCHKNTENWANRECSMNYLTQYTNANETSTWKKTAMVGAWP